MIGQALTNSCSSISQYDKVVVLPSDIFALQDLILLNVVAMKNERFPSNPHIFETANKASETSVVPALVVRPRGPYPDDAGDVEGTEGAGGAASDPGSSPRVDAHLQQSVLVVSLGLELGPLAGSDPDSRLEDDGASPEVVLEDDVAVVQLDDKVVVAAATAVVAGPAVQDDAVRSERTERQLDLEH